MKSLAFVLLALALGASALLSSSCNRIANAFVPSIQGDGNITTETRQTPAFEEIHFEGAYVVVLTQGALQDIRIETDKNILSHITSTVANGTLTISSEGNLEPTGAIKVYVTNPIFNAIESDGSSKVSATTPINADHLSLGIAGSGNYNLEVHTKKLSSDISGSGTMELKGDAANHNIDIAGSGNIKAANLTSDSTSIDIAGSGDAMLNVAKHIDASIAGSGRVKYTGTATDVQSDISGSGKVERVK